MRAQESKYHSTSARQGQELETALSLATALALECRDNKELYTLSSQNHTATYGEGHLPFAKLLAYFARVQSVPARSAPPPAVSPSVIKLPLAARNPVASDDSMDKIVSATGKVIETNPAETSVATEVQPT